jgi:hypothetical protein
VQDRVAQKTSTQLAMPKSIPTGANAEFVAMKLGVKKVKSSVPLMSQSSKKRKVMKFSGAEARDEGVVEEDEVFRMSFIFPQQSLINIG